MSINENQLEIQHDNLAALRFQLQYFPMQTIINWFCWVLLAPTVLLLVWFAFGTADNWQNLLLGIAFFGVGGFLMRYTETTRHMRLVINPESVEAIITSYPRELFGRKDEVKDFKVSRIPDSDYVQMSVRIRTAVYVLITDYELDDLCSDIESLGYDVTHEPFEKRHLTRRHMPYYKMHYRGTYVHPKGAVNIDKQTVT